MSALAPPWQHRRIAVLFDSVFGALYRADQKGERAVADLKQARRYLEREIAKREALRQR